MGDEVLMDDSKFLENGDGNGNGKEEKKLSPLK
jgi:phosphatidylinositol phospholipase C, delta